MSDTESAELSIVSDVSLDSPDPCSSTPNITDTIPPIKIESNNSSSDNRVFFASPPDAIQQTSYSNIGGGTTPKTPNTPLLKDSNKSLPSPITIIQESNETKQDTITPLPESTSTDAPPKEETNEDEPYSVNKILKEKRYQLNSRIIDTLQGNIWKAKNIRTGEIVVIKITNKKLHKNGITLRHGKVTKVQENIIKEKNIMSQIQSHKPPRGFIKLLEFFKDRKNYFLVMEYGGKDFFTWVTSNHEKIKNSEISLKEWKVHTQILFAQMVNLVYFLHNTAKCCHLDISLENMLIKNVKFNKKTGKFLNHGQIFFCDFGLAEIFDENNSFSMTECKKWVGKSQYKSPEVYGKKIFDAKKADIYSLCICLFMMTIGAPPYEKPCWKDATFKFIWNGYLKILLKQWKRHSYMTDDIYDLFDHIICDEKKRYSIDEVMKHRYVKSINKRMKKLYEKEECKHKFSTTKSNSSTVIFDMNQEDISRKKHKRDRKRNTDGFMNLSKQKQNKKKSKSTSKDSSDDGSVKFGDKSRGSIKLKSKEKTKTKTKDKQKSPNFKTWFNNIQKNK